MKKIVTILVLLLSVQQISAQVTVQNLRCEMRVNPLGIEAKQPRLSWQLQSILRNVVQTSYQVIVSSSVQNLQQNKGDVWKSAVINRNQSLHVQYNGAALQPGKKYFWKVIVQTNKGAAQTNQTAFFSIGLAKEQWKAKWIGYDQASAWDSVTQWSRLSARYLRKEFAGKPAVKRATAYISGLGMYELYINGTKIGDQVLAPNPTDYRKTYFYNTHDVTAQIKAGSNAIAAVLGNGRFFTMRQNYKTQKHNTFGFPKLLLQLEIEYTDGTTKTVVSDESWKLNVDGPIRTNNEYDGEEYDATKEFNGWTKAGFNDSKWMQPELVEAPPGKLVAQTNEPMKVMQTVKPISIKKTASGKYILDMGQNFAGWIKLQNINGKKGNKVTLRFAESLQPDGEVFVKNLRDAKVTNIYTLKGTGNESWQPSFVYNGFRYVEVSAFPGTPTLNQFEGKLVYDGIETTGSFQTSNDVLNSIYKNAWWGIASNYKGMPVDCPQRNERQPWLGDRTVGSQGESYMFNNASLYAKWMQDIEDSQTDEGSIPDVAPAFWNYYSDDVTWPAAYFFITNNLYNQFGDVTPIQKHYPSMKKWMMYMKSKYMKNYIVTRDKYGDWCVPPESLNLIHAKDSNRLTDGKLIATAYYYKLLSYVQRFANITNNKEDAKYYGLLSDSIRTAFQQEFYNPKLKQYSNNTVTANLLPLYFGICPDSLRTAVFEKIRIKVHVENHGHISTGLIGSQWIMRGLTEYGYPDLAYIMASNKTYPSWGYMAENGATTIWELWNGNTADPGMNSQNHVMLLGDLLTWFYENLAGIRTNKTDVAFKKIIMKPTLPAGLDFVKASYNSFHGLIKSEWNNSTDKFEWKISIPANTSATVYIPANSIEEISEGGTAIANNKDIKFVKEDDGSVILEVPSGNYTFVRNKKWRKGIVKDEFIFDRASFPESHAATIAETAEGLIASWFGGTKEGNKDVCIWTSHFKNGQWTAPAKVADGVMNDTLRYSTYNPVLFYAPNGELLLFYKIGPNVAGWTGWLIRSKDNGHTWSKREALPEGFLGPIKNKPEFINGVLLCPSSTEKTGWKAHIEFTTDFGKTWTKTEAINDPKILQAIQPSILKYADGRLQILCRSRNTTLNESWSSDGGKTWSEMKASALPNNNSGTDAVTLKDGRQLLVYNHNLPNASWVNGKGPRTPLNVAISKDGKVWSAALVLEDSPISQYSYPSVIQTKDGLVHIVYTWRREKIKHVVVDPNKLELKEIVNKQWPGVKETVGKTTDD
ncbi:family 78 glycoside hydrolase catalytic domain [Lacibacter sediminis]|uniref:alpha-L-rhamnosidase n=1 Tax=Lacibacter sediminis TaxID=2760713 RepID=A0A7G5XJN8_9BACT|nr:family 78 glycoside hydrolase catalytic domain [Lacibacter sediminis]QNA45691.1 family 78 glycoside hydrolase catalytic domain [Lacibacter sediminis]